MQTATTKAPSWRELCDLQPELRKLYNEIQAIRDDGEHFCANYSGGKPPWLLAAPGLIDVDTIVALGRSLRRKL
jgi:hypothetical protein